MQKKGPHTLTVWNRLITTIAMLALVVGNLAIPITVTAQAPTAPAVPAVTATNHLNLSVVSATDATPITTFKYIINIDNTGTTTQRSPAPGSGCSPQDAGYPDSCSWVSIAGVNGSSPVLTQGDQSDFGAGLDLPAGRYLISILADGYKIDGAHFTVPLANPGLVTVQMQPYDLPDATLQAEVFEDNAPTNSAPDVPAERGIAGFVGHIKDYIDEVTTDVYGDPLCGNSHCVSKCYVVDGGADIGIVNPIDAAGRCPFREELPANATTVDTHVAISATAVVEGKLIIPNLGPNRYALSIVPPALSGWVQTTTLEGNHDWDAWVMEGATGLDTEFVVAGEPFPAIFFGYVRACSSIDVPNTNNCPGVASNRSGTGVIKGQALAVSAYIPPVGGIMGETGLLGAKPKDKNPIKSFYVSVSDLNNNDQTIFMGHFDCVVVSGGCPFQINGVPNGDYVLGIWDEPQDYIFGEQNVSIANGEVADIGAYSMLGWWTTIEGHVFNDLNENGKMDAGETGVPGFFISMRTRENSVMDRGTVSLTTDANGYYWMESAYPITQWLVEEAYADGFQTTGITFQADNQPTETTILGQGVDVNVHPVIGLGGRLDWGVKAYAPGTNGGIVGTVSYDTTRNELDPSYAAIEDWQPSISGLTVNLYAPVDCVIDPNSGEPALGEVCDTNGFYEVNPDGSYKQGQLLNQYITETWERPSGCVARDVDGNPLVHGVDENVLPLDPAAPCLEAPMMSVQFGPMSDGTNFGASVNGNYGFGDGCFGPGGFDPVSGACADGSDPAPLAIQDYLVKVEIPTEADVYGADAVNPTRPLYQFTREEDINIANGDSFVPQVPPPACVGPLHTVDVAGSGTDNYPAVIGDGVTVPLGVTVPASSPVDNPTLAVDLGGTVYEGQPKPLCDMKLVHVSDRKSIAPGFNIFTDVPLPGRFWGLTVDDLNFSSNPQSQAYGEKLPLSFNPVGIYDYTNRLIYTVESDYNGLWDVLLPSTNRISCPTPSGVCANLYRFVGNDPGVPGALNLNYNPQYRTIAAEFEAFPGLTLPADLAPFPVAVAVQIPGGQPVMPVSCPVDAGRPQIFAVSTPYVPNGPGGSSRAITISGQDFGAAKGSGQVSLNGVNLPTTSWNNTTIVATVPTSTPGGPRQLKVTASSGQSTLNGLTIHVLTTGAGAYNPPLYEVGPTSNPNFSAAKQTAGRWFAPAETLPAVANHAVQNALDAAPAGALVVVYPNTNTPANPRVNPRGAYEENLIISKRVKLQGTGPGSPDGSVRGAILDGGAYGGDSPVGLDWLTRINALVWAGNQDVYDGAVISLYLPSSGTNAFPTTFSANTAPSIDGFDIRGGDQIGFPGNLNAIFGGFTGPLEAGIVETQGGAIFANAYARNLQITNNIVQNNGGGYGAIRIGTPNIPAPDSSQHNDNVRLLNNRILANGGTNLAGAIGLFNGSDGYEIAFNDVCGSFSAEYGGGISHFGRSNNGKIHDNRIYFNHSYDEGAGIMIAGELATNPTANYGQPGGPQGSGAVDIYNNLIQANMGEDDGGGLRFLMAGNFPINVYNNMIVNNVSMHEGGGVAIDDAPNVRFFNNTVMNNKTTATAITSNGQPAPAGLSTSFNSTQLQATLPVGSSLFSNPLLFNNVFYNNWAGTKGINTVTGITPLDADPWDMGSVDGGILLSPTNSILQVSSHPGVTASPTNILADPAVTATLDIPLSFTSWRTNVNFVGAIMVTADVPPTLLGNYHLVGPGSPAFNLGAALKTGVNAPTIDIDNQVRPALGGFDSGADEYPGAQADLSITKTDGLDTINMGGGAVIYTIVVSNGGPNPVTSASVTDTFPASLTVGSWTCSAAAGSSCTVAGSGNNRTGTVTLPNGGSATFTANTTLSATATGALTNTATVAAPGGTTDPNPANNSATDTTNIIVPLPTLSILDNFNRANASNLNTGAPAGVNWSATTGILTVLRVNGNQANCALLGNCLLGTAIWNGPGNVYGTQQGAAFTFSSNPILMTSLILKASGGAANAPTNFIRVRYTGTQIVVETTTNSGGSFTNQGAFAVTFATGDRLSAVANADGSVDVWRTTAASVTSYRGRSAAVAAFAGTGRIGMQLPVTASVDNFGGGAPALPLIPTSFEAQINSTIFLPAVTNR